ncbi:putative cellulose synthase (UDP-forming) [Helianthus annuus]|nr:putative cellulose synthase (UDP-forming) [Helianthus annuus]
MEEWWKRHNNKLQMVKHQDDGGGHGADDPDLPMMDKGGMRCQESYPFLQAI